MKKQNQYPDWRDADKRMFEQALYSMENNAFPTGIKNRNGSRVWMVPKDQDPIPKRYSFRRNFVRGREALLDKRPVFHRMELQKYVSSPPPTSKARP